jgi:hypothetical protein
MEMRPLFFIIMVLSLCSLVLFFSIQIVNGDYNVNLTRTMVMRQMASTFETQVSSTERLLWEGKAFLFGARQLEKGVSLFLHSHVADLEKLDKIMKNWPGKVSVGAYVNINELFEHNLDIIQQLRDKYKSLTITLYSAIDKYPVNILRNRAVQRVTTELALSSDIFTVPSPGLYDYLVANYDALIKSGTSSVFPIPVFTVDSPDDFVFPQSKEELLEGIKSKKIGINNSTSWFEANDRYKVDTWNEPYLVVDLKYVPLFDERVSHRSNTLQWIEHLSVLNYEFMVIPHHFLITYPHSP